MNAFAKPCPRCGYLCPLGALKCRGCEAWFPEPASPAPAPLLAEPDPALTRHLAQTRSARRRRRFLWLAVLPLIALFALAFRSRSQPALVDYGWTLSGPLAFNRNAPGWVLDGYPLRRFPTSDTLADEKILNALAEDAVKQRLFDPRDAAFGERFPRDDFLARQTTDSDLPGVPVWSLSGSVTSFTPDGECRTEWYLVAARQTGPGPMDWRVYAVSFSPFRPMSPRR